MRPIHPFHVVELRELITKHLGKKDLVACILVSKSWAVSLRPVLWESVIVSNLGPDFSNPETQDLLRHTRHLEICMSVSDEKAFWTPITKTILALGTVIPLSSIKLCRHPGTNAFWDALLTCTTLRSLTLSDLHADLEHVYNLWRVAQTVESITFHNATTKANSNIYCSPYRKPFFRLRHLVLEGDSSLQWIDGPVLPWLRAPNLETIRCMSPNAISWMDISNMVRDIKGTKKAIAEGVLFYGPGERESRVDYVRGQERRLISSMWIPEDSEELERYRGLVPGKRIREFECVLPSVSYCFVAEMIRNMDALEKFAAHGKVEVTMCPLVPLMQHVETLVELNIRDCKLSSDRLVMLLEQCPRLEVFVAYKLDISVAIKSLPWACVGLRQLRVKLYSNPELTSRPGFDEEQKEMMERLAELPCLERFYMPEYWHRGGLDCLHKLTKVQDVQFKSTSVEMMTVADAEWMVEQWPVLRMVRIRPVQIRAPVGRASRRARMRPTTETKIASEVLSVFKDHGVECLFVDIQSP